MIVSSCGTGKTYFCSNTLLERLPDVKPCEVVFVTSRSITAAQQAADESIVEYYDYTDSSSAMAWSGECDISTIAEKGIQVMTYDKLINLLLSSCSYGLTDLQNVKLIVLDECHTLFTDTFINNMELLKFWIHINLKKEEKVFIGLTATPEIVYHSANRWGVTINNISPPLYKYSAKQLWCTNSASLPELLTEKLGGKSIVMCNSAKMCYKLQAILPRSAVLVSKNNDAYVDFQMKELRSFITHNRKLPNNIDTLITTSTLREGFGFSAESNIRNVVSFLSDSTHLVQFAGRCRFDVENLVVVDCKLKPTGVDFVDRQREAFKKYISDDSETDWFDSIRHIVSHPADDVLRFFSSSVLPQKSFKVPSRKERPLLDKYTSVKAVAAFCEYVKKELACVPGAEKPIYKPEDQQAVVDEIIKLKLLKTGCDEVTFQKAVNIIKDLGFTVLSKKKRFNGEERRYKLIYKKEE